MGNYFVYMVRCRDGSLYTGYARDIENRLRLHNSGKGAKYTRSRRPVRLVYHESFDSQGEAMRREIVIKTSTRPAKQKLIRDFHRAKRAAAGRRKARG